MAETWEERFGRAFDQAARSAGRAAREAGRVEFHLDADAVFRGTVEEASGEHYGLELALRKGRLAAQCSCPGFASEPLCRHMWAALLELDAQGVEIGPAGRLARPAAAAEQPGAGREPGGGVRDAARADAADGLLSGDAEPAPPPRAQRAERGSSVTRGSGSERPPRGAGPRDEPPVHAWQALVHHVTDAFTGGAVERESELLAVIEPHATPRRDGALPLELWAREEHRQGGWLRAKPARFSTDALASLREPEDRELLALLGAQNAAGPRWGAGNHVEVPVYAALAQVRRLAMSGRCFYGNYGLEAFESAVPLVWDGEEAWRVVLRVTSAAAPAGTRGAGAAKPGYSVSCELRRGEETLLVSELREAHGSGLLVLPGRLGCVAGQAEALWLTRLRSLGSVIVPERELEAFVTACDRPGGPELELPAELGLVDLEVSARLGLVLEASPGARGSKSNARVLARALALYGARRVALGQGSGGAVIDLKAKRRVARAPALEAEGLRRLGELGFRPERSRRRGPSVASGSGLLELDARLLNGAVGTLLDEGWLVEGEGRRYRRAGVGGLRFESGIDWFELSGKATLDGVEVSLPELLAGLRKGGNVVRLGDGTIGVLPEEWLRRLLPFAHLGETEPHGEGTDEPPEAVRFRRSQVALLDTMLARLPDVDVDAGFRRLRDAVTAWTGPEAAQPGPGFVGALRTYQEEGLGWLMHLERVGFGGCLADEMGLGKTIQVLALLERFHAQRLSEDAPEGASREARTALPSLVVAPRSLVHNWLDEAARFTPQLRVRAHLGAGRRSIASDIAEGGLDVFVTSYATLRRDIEGLAPLRFGYVILDEAQAIKNADALGTKAVRLLSAEHRLALTGTPVENHLGELESLMEFLNPGVLSGIRRLERARAALASAELGLEASEGFEDGESGELAEEPEPTAPREVEQAALRRDGEAAAGSALGAAERAHAEALGAAVRPFILRRTKAEVARELPERIEQTLYVDLGEAERQRYDELQRHYRTALRQRVDELGVGRSTPHILEALLRLRQAACHPGLLDPALADAGSAKLDCLVERLEEVVAEEHKALVFSQFVSLLDLVAPRLAELGIRTERLDGKTRERRERVERFQTDSDVKVFLISLKAGGVGLNLTAADTVFLLDPWWNPAAEAQAIDRAHRLGQERRVLAFRLIARGTVEEKVARLQARKRDLYDAILGEGSDLSGKMTRAELEDLLA